MKDTIPFKPELLAPAGSLEKLKVAALYGADAVYTAGQRYGLRAGSENLTYAELKQGVQFAHEHDTKVYVVLNAFLHDGDLDGLPEFCEFLESIHIDAVIVSDLGVFRIVQRHSSIPIHVSTQSSCMNTESAKLWKGLGAKRIIAARELTLRECGEMQRDAEIPVESFIHGSMCMAYSGRCTISNFTAGRDSNRGGCKQSCRHEYSHEPIRSSVGRLKVIQPHENGALHFMSSKDLIGIDSLPDAFEQRIESLKIEGRMRSPFYLASVVRAYRRALDSFAQNGQIDAKIQAAIEDDLSAFPHRDYCSGSLDHPADVDTIYLEGSPSWAHAAYEYLGLVLESSSSEALVRIHRPVRTGMKLEFLHADGETESVLLDELRTTWGKPIPSATQGAVIAIPRKSTTPLVHPFTVVRQEAPAAS